MYLIFAVSLYKPMIEDYPIFTFLLLNACGFHGPTKFHANQTTQAQLIRHIDFSRWRPWRHKSTSGCRWSEKVQKIMFQSVDNFSRYVHFSRFSLSVVYTRKCLLPPISGRFLGVDPTNVVRYCRDPLKGTFLAGNTRFGV